MSHSQNFNIKPNSQQTWLHFLLKEWLLLISAIGLVLTSLYLKSFPLISSSEWEVLLILYALFVTVRGLEDSGLFAWASWRIEQGKHLPLKLVLTTFFFSMLITNDVALIIVVPITMASGIPRKDIVVILEALAANAGSALTPIGNPQNLFIYWYYHVTLPEFVMTIAPLTMTFLCFLSVLSLLIPQNLSKNVFKNPGTTKRSAILHGFFLLIMLLIILHFIPVTSSIFVLICASVFSRSALRIDYALLLTFLCFFGVAENLRELSIHLMGNLRHIFLFSAISSQVMSNVPATILFAKFTTQWKDLLWGTNIGGFGSLIGSLANIIAYKIYISHKNIKGKTAFTIKFLALGYLAFFIGIGIYFLFNGRI